MAVDLARQEWASRKEDEVNLVLESASSQLVEQFEQQKKEAMEKAVGEARVRTSVTRLIKPLAFLAVLQNVVYNGLFYYNFHAC